MAASPTERSSGYLEFVHQFCRGSTRVTTAIWTSWCSWDIDPKVVWTISLQGMLLSSRKWSCVEVKYYRRDGPQIPWNFHSQPQEIYAESLSRVEDTGDHSEENSTELLQLYSYILQLVQNPPIIYMRPVWLDSPFHCLVNFRVEKIYFTLYIIWK
jgi:hypothetical protein